MMAANSFSEREKAQRLLERFTLKTSRAFSKTRLDRRYYYILFVGSLCSLTLSLFFFILKLRSHTLIYGSQTLFRKISREFI